MRASRGHRSTGVPLRNHRSERQNSTFALPRRMGTADQCEPSGSRELEVRELPGAVQIPQPHVDGSAVSGYPGHGGIERSTEILVVDVPGASTAADIEPVSCDVGPGAPHEQLRRSRQCRARCRRCNLRILAATPGMRRELEVRKLPVASAQPPEPCMKRSAVSRDAAYRGAQRGPLVGVVDVGCAL